ncbi:MAG: 2OG-Fe(II) oxygenase [Alphaproteobacteria bacterium]|nr:2OG-Fe(II) oxygenase [Alphaproteobacteria bacterium]
MAEPQVRVPRFTIGDIVPSFNLTGPDGAPLDIGGDECAGHFRVLLFGTGETMAAAHRRLAEKRAALTKHGALLYAVWPGPPTRAAPNDSTITFLFDPDRRIEGAFRPKTLPTDRPFVIALCPNQHLLCLGTDLATDVDVMLAAIMREARHFHTSEGGRQPPVLMVPRVFSTEDCATLIERFRTEGNVYIEPGHGDKGMTQDYKMRIPEYGRDDRIDHWLMNPETVSFINERLKRRFLPEVRKAFAYNITRHEPYRITKYEGARGGELHGHRDNSEVRVAHRRFALSINLNSEQFEGGGLRFPEYGGQVYRPPSGTALLFSSSLLHEALHVTKGRRFVLLGFMFGET